MKAIKKTFAVILCMIMTLSMFSVLASADNITPDTIDTTKKGSITIHKYEYNGNATLVNGTTGTTADAANLPADATGLADAKGLNGVTFSLYKVMNAAEVVAYYNGTNTDAKTVNDYLISSGAIDSNKIKNGWTTQTATTATVNDQDGYAKFDNLEVGMYVVIETGAPSKVTQRSAPFLVSIPMTTTGNGENWFYDVHVYPKNETSEGNVKLVKQDANGTKLAGVVFKLEKYDTASYQWNPEGSNATTAANTGEISWNNLTPGDYRITEVSTLDGYIADKRPIAFTVTTNNTITCTDSRTGLVVSGSGEKSLTLTLTNYKPDLTKKISGNVSETNAAVGSEVDYVLTVAVPANIANLQTFTVTDTPTNLKDDTTTVKVYKANGTDEITGENKGYAVSANGENGFTVTFDTTKTGITDEAGKNIVIKYSAKVLAAAVSGEAPNSAKLTYSNEILSSGTPGTKYIEDRGIVYTYQIDVTKTLQNADTEVPNGVVFYLYKGSDTEPMGLVSLGNGEYRPADTTVNTPETTTTDLTTAANGGTNGKLIIKGLSAATYHLEEIKTVAGYNLLSGKVDVNLNISTETTWTTTEIYDANGNYIKKSENHTTTYTGTGNANNTVATNIVNKKGLQLPQTGGIGTAMFIVLGGVLIAVGSYMLFVRGKKRDF